LDKFGYENTDWNRWTLAKSVAAAMQRSNSTLRRLSLGSDEGAAVPSPSNRAASITTKRSATKGSSISLTDLFDGWWAEAKAAGRKPSTHESYQSTFSNFRSFLGHDDATAVSPQDVVQ